MKYNTTALWTACANGHAEVVKALLSYPNINANVQRGIRGETALMAACAGGYAGIVQLFATHRGIQFEVKDWVIRAVCFLPCLVCDIVYTGTFYRRETLPRWLL